MRAHVRNETSVDNQTLVRVTWERETAEANAPTIEAVFQYNRPSEFNLTDLKPGVLLLLSVTRTDTRRPIVLTDEETPQIYELASDWASEMLQ
jgi:hypothetical protein